jgi:hypothetical protein
MRAFFIFKGGLMPLTQDLDDIQNLVESLVSSIGAQAAALVIVTKDGPVSLFRAGFERHRDVNDALVLGLHINMNDHDSQVLAGSAGADAQALAESLN